MKCVSLCKVRISVLTPLFVCIFAAGILCSTGCVNTLRRTGPEDPWEDTPPESSLSWEILDYRDRESGGTIPRWLNSYLEGGIAFIERLEEFENYYVFIGVNSGTNYNAMEQWNTGFSPELDFARLAAARIERRFLRAARTNPDDEYGSYFIALIRSASDAFWEGAVRDDDFWLYRSHSEGEDPVISRESYDFFILVKAEKNTLVSQIRTLLENVVPEYSLSADQSAAINRVRERFFDGF